MGTTAETATVGTVEELDPRTLVVAANVRADVQLDAAFVASLRDLGVLEPVTVVSDGDEVRVRYGQRRTLGAIEAGLATIPARVIDVADDEALRIVAQMAENDHRTALSNADRRVAYEQLSGLGLTAAQIAKRTHRSKEEVQAATAASASPAATAALAQHQDSLSLLDAAAIAEFEDDEQVVSSIVQAAIEGESTAHVIQQARDERADRNTREVTAASLRDKGLTVIDRPPYGSPITEVSRLLGTREATRPIREEEHETCPGHAVYLAKSYMRSGDSAYSPIYVCTDPKGNGHTVADPYGRTQPVSGPMSEEQKAERRAVIENNKAWDAAVKVRAEWLASFAKGTGKLVDVERFIAHAVARGETPARTYQDTKETARIERMSAPAATRHAAALILAAWDQGTSRLTWRSPSATDARMMGAMTAWGYTPGPVERLLMPKAAKKRTTTAKSA
ncbi:ParB/RepB/Spo0J family partition protein [Allobranchiibius huperziae]|uniref:ParB family chromosome partitioning protein n=1 Tax=Allobranchiibius huperziae TaxID=1874116 RepID=A0A853DKQ0_9MICO|nr:ParB N-terminal domain-containing protein [Allobranchiibius huperziae]NYJ76519.1 ParB family chromosome partitioning protein [Allobranchiibius huperziae]